MVWPWNQESVLGAGEGREAKEGGKEERKRMRAYCVLFIL
jgi:hypothetical protein